MVGLKAKVRKVPRFRLLLVRNMISELESLMWINENYSCSTYIHEVLTNSSFQNYLTLSLLKLMRQHLTEREWRELCQFIGISKPNTKNGSVSHYPIFLRYAIICLAYNVPDLKEKFMQSVLMSTVGNIHITSYTSVTAINKKSDNTRRYQILCNFTM